MPVSGKRPTSRLPMQISFLPAAGRVPSVTLTLARTCHACALTPRTTTLASLVVSPSRPSGIDHVHLGARERAAVGPARDVRRGGERADRVAVEPARHLGVGALSQHEHVLLGAGLRERRGEAVGEGEHADEHRHHEPDAERGERGGHRALADAPEVVGERDLHSTFRSAATTGSRAARTAGTIPLASISSSAIAGADRQRGPRSRRSRGGSRRR